MLSILALIAVHNGGKTLARVLDHFHANEIPVVVIDHGSTDATAGIAARYLGRPISEVIKLPFDGIYRLSELLALKDSVIKTCTADWVIHADADEIMDSPRNGESLRAMIERTDAHGYDTIDCDEFVFPPCSEEEDYSGRDFVAEMRRYYHFTRAKSPLHRAVRREDDAGGWARGGGHRYSRPNPKVAPEKIRLRHYMGLSLDHLRSQYLGRVFDAEALRRGWHRNRVATSKDYVVVPEAKRLRHIDVDGWQTGEGVKTHLFFRPRGRYEPPPVVSGSSEHAPIPFIVGVGQVGPGLLCRILEAHPRLAIAKQTTWLQPAIRAIAQAPGNGDQLHAQFTGDPNWAGMNIAAGALRLLLDQLLPEKPSDLPRAIYRAYAERQGVERVCDHSPRHGLAMLDIAAVLPEARFIHVIADGRDVAVGLRHRRAGTGMEVREAAIFWLWRTGQIRQQAQFLPHYLEVRYEDLLREPEATLRALCEFIELPFDPLQPGRQVPSAIERRIEPWRTAMTAEELVSFERIAGDMLADLGYPRAL